MVRGLSVGLMAALILLVAGMRGPIGVIAASSVGCNGVYDPYSATKEFLAACDVPTHPLVEVESLPDGGKSYLYDVNGDVGWTNVPPARFDPSAASAADLQLYGYPERRVVPTSQP